MFLIKNKSVLISLLTAFFCVLLVLFTYKDYGLALDEPIYGVLGGFNAEWVRNPKLSTIDNYWPIDDRHPPFFKIIGGFTRWIFTEQLHIVDKYTSFRFATLPFVFLLSFLMSYLVAKWYGTVIGICAGLSVILMPRVFFESHLGTLDFSVTALWFSAVVSTILGTKKWKWYFASIIFTGLAIGTKIQGFFLYALIVLYWLLTLFFFIYTQRKLFSKTMWRYLSRFIASIIIPPSIFITVWPWMWPDIQWRFGYFMYLMKERYPVETYYLHTSYTNNPGSIAPWHYPWVMTFVTIPVFTLALFIIGAICIIKYKKKHELLLLINAAFPLLVLTLPQAQKYDGVRLFLSTYPFIVFVSSVGIYRLSLLSKKFRKHVSAGLAAFTILSLVVIHYRIHPFQMSYFNGLVGGTKGAQERGFETEYWATSYLQATEFIRKYPNGYYCAYPFPLFLEKQYKELGFIPESTNFTPPEFTIDQMFANCTYFILLSRQGFLILEPAYWKYYKEQVPVYSVKADGAAIVNIYKLR